MYKNALITPIAHLYGTYLDDFVIVTITNSNTGPVKVSVQSEILGYTDKSISQVTVDALRHYDKLNLLKPAHLDRFTGYRYYSLKQLPRLNRILALKEQIDALKAEEQSAERRGDLEKVAEIRYGRLIQAQKELDGRSAELAAQGS